MPAALAEVRQEWHRFRDDKPGERFCNHRERMQKKSKTHAVVSMALGVLLLAGGVVLLFIPGPGLLLILFGVALVASHSEKLSAALDRAEPPLRERGERVARWWTALPRMHKAALITGGLVILTAGLVAIWKWVVVAYLL